MVMSEYHALCFRFNVATYFPPEEDAKALSAQGPKALKEEARRRTQWHNPVPQILEATRSPDFWLSCV
jgi:hypothetical protein